MNEFHTALPIPGEPCKLITAVIPDDGTDLKLMRALRQKKAVIRANSASNYASSVLAEAKAKPGKLPEPILARVVEILVPEASGDDLFDFVCEHANIDYLGGGVVFMSPAPFCTPYALPPGVPDEKGQKKEPVD